jgi:hypothetical protein
VYRGISNAFTKKSSKDTATKLKKEENRGRERNDTYHSVNNGQEVAAAEREKEPQRCNWKGTGLGLGSNLHYPFL